MCLRQTNDQYQVLDMFAAALVVFVLCLFMFVDVWYFIRLFPLFLKRCINYYFGKDVRLTREDLLKTTSVDGIVLPFDLDFMFHMNNSKYLREMDFGRVSHFMHSNLYSGVLRTGGSLVVAATMIRYRRSLNLWQRFTLQTRNLCWNDGALYVEQRFRSKDGFVCAVALLKMCVKGTTIHKVLEKVCVGNTDSPAFLPEVKSWAESISSSSESLKKERLN